MCTGELFFQSPSIYKCIYKIFLSLFLIQGSHSCGQPSDSLGDLVIGLHIIGFWSSGRICFYPKTSHQLNAETKAFKREACVKLLYIWTKNLKNSQNPNLCNPPKIYTANVYRELQGLCGEIGVRGFQISVISTL